MRKNLAVFLSLLLMNGCASTAEYDGPEALPHTAGLTEEQMIGEQIHREILASFHSYTDPRVVTYMKEVGEPLAASADRRDLNYQFTILYSEKIYATSAPGGYVYVTTGMLNFLESEAELAAILAHEIAELQYQDPRFSKKDQAISTVAKAGAQIGPMFGTFGSLAALGLVLLQAYNESTHKTPEERLLESDKTAMQYLLKAGYDPQALLDVQDHFLRAGEKVVPYFYDYYQSRPISEERMASLKKEFQKLPLMEKELKTDSVEYQETMKGVREMSRFS